MNEDDIRQDPYLFGTPNLTPEEEQALAVQAAAEAQEMEAIESFANRQQQEQQLQQPAPQQAQGTSQPRQAQPTGQGQKPKQQDGFDHRRHVHLDWGGGRGLDRPWHGRKLWGWCQSSLDSMVVLVADFFGFDLVVCSGADSIQATRFAPAIF